MMKMFKLPNWSYVRLSEINAISAPTQNTNYKEFRVILHGVSTTLVFESEALAFEWIEKIVKAIEGSN